MKTVNALVALTLGMGVSLAEEKDFTSRCKSGCVDWLKSLLVPDWGLTVLSLPGRCVDWTFVPTRAKKEGDDWYALLSGDWVKMPPKKMLKETSIDGYAYVFIAGDGGVVCFVRPGNSPTP